MSAAAVHAISVVIPLYNKGGTIGRCIQSVLSQTFVDFEVVVIDDGSTDSGASIARGFDDPRIRVISQENRGVSAARNRGISEAVAPLIAFLDADDTWEPQFLEAVAQLARDFPDAGIFATGQRHYLGPGQIIDTHHRLPNGAKTGLIRDYLAGLREGNFIWPSNVLAPRHVLDEVGGFPEDASIGEDRDLWVRISLRYPIAYDTRILAIYHITPGQSTCSRQTSSSVPFPAAIRTLRYTIAGGTLEPAQVERARALLDWSVLDFAYNWVERNHRTQAFRTLREHDFHYTRFRAEAWLLRLALFCVPSSVISLLKHKHLWLPNPIDRRKVVYGKALIHRRM